MTEQEQFLETVKQILKPKKPSNLPPRGISVDEMIRKLETFNEELASKREKIDQMMFGYINTRNPSKEEIDFIKGEIISMYNDFSKSFNS